MSTTTLKAHAIIDRMAKRARMTRTVTMIAALAASGILVSQASYSAFTAHVESPANSWTTGTVSVSSDINGKAAFVAPNMKPGDVGSKIITVTTKSNYAGDVRMYVEKFTKDDKNLADYVTVTITPGVLSAKGEFKADAGQAFTGTMTQLAAKHNSYATGAFTDPIEASGKAEGGSEEEETHSKSYKIDWQFSKEAPDTVQGASITTDFVWALHS